MNPKQSKPSIFRPSLFYFLQWHTGRQSIDQLIGIMLAHAQAYRMIAIGQIFRPG